MKNTTITVIMTATILIAGCGKKSPGSSATPPPAQAGASSSSSVMQPVLTAWQQGDKAAAISSFLAADWSARPLFATGSTLSLSEDQFKALSRADHFAKSKEGVKQLDSLEDLAAAVEQAGHDAVSKGDVPQARKYFTSLKQCGVALDSADHLILVQIVGKLMKSKADTELSKIGQ
jgi:hypothetical protein